MNPKISVIIPVYNTEKYICQCADSILAQTFTDFELLLIDDGSKDNSGKICDEYAKKDPRVKVFHKKNGGVSSARNLGLDNAEGEWICFVDSDDTQNDDFLNLYMTALKEDDYDIIFQNFTLHQADGRIYILPCQSQRATTLKEVLDLLLFLKENVRFGWAWNKIFKASIIKRNKLYFRTDINLREDELFTLEYYKHVRKAKFIAESPYQYYIYGNSLTRRMKDPIEYIRIAKELYNSAHFFFNSPSIKKYEDTYLLRNLRYAYLLCYMETVDKKTRLDVIKELLSFYRTHKEIKLKYGNFISTIYYNILFRYSSPQMIDLLSYTWFSTKQVLKR